MKKTIMIIWVLLCPAVLLAEDIVNIPWQEFKTLYHESIERKLLADKTEQPHVYSIDTADYKLKIEEKGCFGSLTLEGSSIAGKPEPIPIFKKNIIIKKIHNVSGGSLLCNSGEMDGISFLPYSKGPFSIKVAFYLPIMEDNRSKLVTMAIPKALKNSLSLDVPSNASLLEIPGVVDASGVCHFTSQPLFSVRFSDKKETKKAVKDSIDNFSKKYQTVQTPPIVLDTISYFTTMEENGTILSMLVMTIPDKAGPHLKISTIPGADIWSLNVNGEPRKLYINGKNRSHWMIPLAKEGKSHIELALIRQQGRTGLHGRLEVIMPGMDLPSRKVNLAIALPERLEMISYEGPVSPVNGIKIKPPAEFMGRPYYFSQAFYKGQGMKMAVLYKEPVKQNFSK